uniref:Uncharacterized protein n=1 Tax=Tetranychus urticae TaxID=32264 RepID=T1KDH1_TETUR
MLEGMRMSQQERLRSTKGKVITGEERHEMFLMGIFLHQTVYESEI